MHSAHHLVALGKFVWYGRVRIGSEFVPETYVTLDQAAAMVRRNKRTLERLRKLMPAPQIVGKRGQAHMWRWSALRPWLEDRFRVTLPERFPGK